VGRYQFTDEERKVLESLPQPLAIYQFIDKRVATLVLSSGFCEVFGYVDRAQAYYDMDNDMYRDTHPDDVARIAEAAVRFATQGGRYDVVYRTKDHRSGGYRIIHAKGEHRYTEEGVRLAHVSYTDEGPFDSNRGDLQGSNLMLSFNEMLREESIVQQSTYDYLTGLPSMTYFFELAEAGRRAIEERGGEPVMLYLDLSGMQVFNTQNGYGAGDKLIREFANLLKATFSHDSCCRISGDHFAVYTEEAGLDKVLQRFFDECAQINAGNSLPVRVGVFPRKMGNGSVSEACDGAKLACDALRTQFASSYGYYDSAMREDTERRLHILATIDKAIDQGWIKVFYQPIVRGLNGRVCNEEALSRWFDPEYGVISPAEFIPVLETAGTIYKLDLHVLDQALRKMRLQQQAGLYVVPTSINLSRADFTACDIVSEIAERVDASGFSRDMIAIEVTESILGSDFEFMNEQVKRLRAMGFPVWMDDFGSGYSSMDVLQSVEFDLIKFDMSFMRRLSEGDSAKTVLAELVKMATSLGIDTLCEGVETEEQKRFLQEVGCSKLQGFLFCRPVSFEEICNRYERGIQIGFENPAESDYYDTIGRLNLYDLAVMANEEDALRKYFDVLPMGVIEVDGDSIEYARSNQSYRDFLKRFYGVDIGNPSPGYTGEPFDSDSSFVHIVNQCCRERGRVFFDETMPDGSTVHSFIRYVRSNPVTGKTAIVAVVLSVSEVDEGATYAGVVRALTADYFKIYYVDLVSEGFIEYSLNTEGEELAVQRHGERFFEAAQNDAPLRIHADDLDSFLAVFSRQGMSRELSEHDVFYATYRLAGDDPTRRVGVKIVRLNAGSEQVVVGIRNLFDGE
jgi:diguanylate cyclase (GGDEF)-like protein